MEVATLGGLLGIGYLVSKVLPKKGVMPSNMTSAPARTITKEGFVPVARGPDRSALTQMSKGASATGFGPELDMMYKYTSGQTYSSEPNPGPHGTAFSYGTQRPPLSPAQPSPAMKPELQPIGSNKALVEFRSDNIEQMPNYSKEKFVVSPLSGEQIPSEEYIHNNMQPYFGGRIKQNTNFDANKGILDAYNGSASLQFKKQEVETMFDSARAPYGNPFGMEDNTNFFQSRIEEPTSRKGEKPFESIRVGPGINDKGGLAGKGGFQQFEVNEIMRPRTTNQLRVETNPKDEYTKPIIPGAHYIGTSSDNPGEVRKYKPDRFYVDETGERFFTTTGGLIKETVRSVQVLPHTTRPETSVERFGTATSQDHVASYTAGSYRAPMTQQYSGAGYRNATMEGYSVSDPDTPQADHGRSSFVARPNERSDTSERGVALNLVPAEAGNVSIHYKDGARPTRRSEIVGAIRIAGAPVGYADATPAITIWDPQDVARTTVKESTILLDKFGIASPASAPTRLKVYDPDDIARPTQKSCISKNSWYGPSMAAAQDFMDTTAASNMRTNPNKEVIARRRKPIAGAGNVAVFTGDHGNQTSQKLDIDFINNHAPVITRPVSLPPGTGDMGRTEFRVPLKLDVSRVRNTVEMISAVENNPLQQSLARNARNDDHIIQELRQTMKK